MKDFKELRTAVGTALAAGRSSVHVDVCAAVQLLEELDAMRAAAKIKPEKRNDYPADFEEVWTAYPPRSGANKVSAFKAWSARIKAGAAPGDILAGVQRYAAYVLAEGTEDRYIKQPVTFLGPDKHYTLPWKPISANKAGGRKGQIHGSFGEQDFTAGTRPDGSF